MRVVFAASNRLARDRQGLAHFASGKCRVDGGIVTQHAMVHRSHDTDLVHVLRHSGQMFTHGHAGDVGIDGTKFPANRFVGFGLHVEGIDLTDAPHLK